MKKKKTNASWWLGHTVANILKAQNCKINAHETIDLKVYTHKRKTWDLTPLNDILEI